MVLDMPLVNVGRGTFPSCSLSRIAANDAVYVVSPINVDELTRLGALHPSGETSRLLTSRHERYEHL